MNRQFEMRFTGSGGQGVILASVIIAEAAVIAGAYAIQSQSYGPEARGGLCKGEAILSHSPIWFSKVTSPDFVLALTQESLEKYSKELKEDAIVMADDGLVIPDGLNPDRVITVPVLKTAREVIGNPMTANIVAVGAINAALNLFDQKTLQDGIRRHVPAGTEDLNLKAMEAGAGLITPEQVSRFSPLCSYNAQTA